MKQPELIVIDRLQDTKYLPGYLDTFEYVALDTETTGVHKGCEVIGYSFCAEEGFAYYVILAYWDKEAKKLIYLDTMDSVKEIMQVLATKQLIGHNFLFDAEVIEHNFKTKMIEALHTDTMVLAHLLDENREIALKELAKIYFGENAADEQKEMKASVLANGGIWQDKPGGNKEMYKADKEILAKYGAKDAWLTYKLFFVLLEELLEQNMEDFFYNDESMPLLKGPTYELNTTGLRVDTQKMQSLGKQLEAECIEHKHFIMTEIDQHIKDKYPGDKKKNIFNIGSSQQLAWLLFGKLNLEFTALTDGGKAICKHFGLKAPYTRSAQREFIATCQRNVGQIVEHPSIFNGKKKAAKKVKEPWAYIKCDKKSLQKHQDKYKWIKALLDFQKKKKINTTYVEGILRQVQYGIIHPSFLQCGTITGRYSSKNPNFQNLPRDDKRIKECIIARPGKKFVGADMSQLEPRVFSYYSGDKRLMDAFDGTKDFYSVVGMDVFGKIDCTPQKEGSPEAFGIKYKALRDRSKTIALARAYGALAFQLAKTTGKTTEQTQDDIDNYDEAFPGVKKMMIDAHKLVKRDGFVTNLFGRKRRLPEAKRFDKIYGSKIDHADLPYEARQVLNAACNFRIQSTGASIVNRGAIRLAMSLKDAGIDAKFVCQVHDSIIIECSEADAEDVAVLLQDAMENAVTLEGILFEAVPKIGNNLAEV